jgi:hypothetical protein
LPFAITVTAVAAGIAGLFNQNKVTRYHGEATFAGAGRVVIAGAGGGKAGDPRVRASSGRASGASLAMGTV